MTAAHHHHATKPYGLSRSLHSLKKSKRSTMVKLDSELKNQDVSSAKMAAAHDHHQATKPYCLRISLHSFKKSKRSTMVKLDSELKNQVVSSAKMTTAHDLHQLTKTYGISSSLHPCKESIRSIMIKQDSELKSQIAELHLIYKRQIELMKEIKETLTRKCYNDQQLESMAQQEVYQAAEILVSMSSSSPQLLWFAKTVTSVKSDAELAFVPKRARMAAVASQQKTAKHLQILNQDNDWEKGKKQKFTNVRRKCMINVEPKASVNLSWGNIIKGKRRKRVRDRNPFSTFLRGGFLNRWR